MKHLLLGLGLLTTSVSATAVETAVGLTVGTIGAGAEVTFGFNENIAVRGLFTTFDHDESVEADDVDYDATYELGGYGIMFDYHPFGGKFRVSTGLMKSTNELTGSAVATTPIQIGNNPANQFVGGRIDMSLDSGGTVPYIGVGFGSPASEGFPFGFGVDLGVMPMSPEVDVRLTGGNAAVVAAAGNAIQEEEQNIQNDLDEFELWPVLQFKASYRF